MGNAVIFNENYVITSSVFEIDKYTDMQYSFADLLTPYGMFIPLGEGGMSLLRVLQSEFHDNVYGAVNPTLLPPQGSLIRGILVAMRTELVSFSPTSSGETTSTIMVSSLPEYGKDWKVFQTGSYHHDSALAQALKGCRKPKTAYERLNEFTASKIIDPHVIDIKKLRASPLVKKWLNLKSQFIGHDVKL